MSTQRHGKSGHMVLKLDMSKAYDRVEWIYLESIMLKMGFQSSWVNLIMGCVCSISFSILVNGSPHGYFTPSRGLRQGDPLSPYLFLLCAEGLHGLLSQAESRGQIQGISLCRNGPRLTHLFFADDCLLFCKENKTECDAFLQILNQYEFASRQQLNRSKTTLFFSKCVAQSTQDELIRILGVPAMRRYEKYLGLPSFVGRSKKASFAQIKDQVWNKLQGWKHRFLSQVGKEILIKSIIQAMPAYSMSCFKLLVDLCNDLEELIRKFWWGYGEEQKKVHWIISPRNYFSKDATVSCLINQDQHEWKTQLIKHLFLPHEASSILGMSLSSHVCMDTIIWPHTTNEKYLVRSAYRFLLERASRDRPSHSNMEEESKLWKNIWSLKVIPCIKSFLWKACLEALPTKANFFYRHLVPSPICDECQREAEDILHVIWYCKATNEVWRESSFWHVLQNSPPRSLAGLISEVMNCKDEVDIQSFAATTWLLWNRRNKGTVMGPPLAALSKRIICPSSPAIIEALAALEVVKLAKTLGLTEVEFEGDASVIISTLGDSSPNLSPYAIFSAEAQQNESIISLGSFLKPTTNSSWLSRSGLYAFGFYQQSNGYAVGVFLAGIPGKTVVWTANRDNPPVLANVTLNFTSDGILLMQPAQSKKTYIANPADRATTASMLDSGNFVMYNSDKKIIWQSFDYPTNTILEGQRLAVGKELFSSVSESDQSTGIFRLSMQTDGNLVQYPVGTSNTAAYSYWSSGTYGQGNNVSLCLDDDAHLYLLNSTGKILNNLTEGGNQTKDVVYLMRIDADGIFRLYSHKLDKNGNWSVIWFSSNNKCDPKGLCGLNGFCTTDDQDANCLCLPRFERVNNGSWTSGCERNFTAESCKNKGGRMIYSMEPLPNTVWEDNSFSILSSTKEDCETSCLEDCNCEAAIYSDGTCRKQRFPLRFGRQIKSNSNVAFIKRIIRDCLQGTIWNGQKLVAVKRLEKVLAEGEREFQTEMKVIGRTHHKNLVRLLGYCHDRENRLLVYEYMSNGSLADILFTPEKQPCWGERIEIARNIAKGILYLHEECESQIIHCDIKPHNILMDEYRCPKISDFGLAKLLDPEQTKTFTGIRGTKGYVAPEWHRNQPITVKADVYSFGIVLLELICCRKSVDWNLCEEESILEEWAYHCFEVRELDKLVSGMEVDKRQLERMVKVGLWCILDEPSLRPSMKKVLLMLEGTVDIPIPPSPTSFLSSI
uniref:Non-specific serine/threonine protein kinase n=2 Tax=Fagus sylvatica TaxID=28930 RepID=A0A2N9J9T5_FAGSY